MRVGFRKDMEDIVMIGFGGHAKSVVDSIIRDGKYNVVGYTDKSNYGVSYEYLGSDQILRNLYNSGVRNAQLSIGYLGNSKLRYNLAQSVKGIGFFFPPIIDPSSIVANSSHISEGVFVGKNSVINAEAFIGEFAIINTSAIVEHDCNIGAFTHIAVGTTICGSCDIGENAFIGANTTVIQGIKVGDNSIIGAGGLILADVPSNAKVLGVWKG